MGGRYSKTSKSSLKKTKHSSCSSNSESQLVRTDTFSSMDQPGAAPEIRTRLGSCQSAAKNPTLLPQLSIKYTLPIIESTPYTTVSDSDYDYAEDDDDYDYGNYDDNNYDDEDQYLPLTRILFTNMNNAVVFRIFQTIRWIYGSDEFFDTQTWIRHRNELLYQLVHNVLKLINEDASHFILTSVTHSFEQDKFEKVISVLEENYDIEAMESKPSRIHVVIALSELTSQWKNFDELWSMFRSSNCNLWWLKRLNNPDIRPFLFDDNPMSVGKLEYFLRGYQHQESFTSDTLHTQHSYVTQKYYRLPAVINHWSRVECGFKEGYIYRDILSVILDFYCFNEDGLNPKQPCCSNELTKCSVMTSYDRIYEWKYVSMAEGTHSQWLDAVCDTDVFIHDVSLVECLEFNLKLWKTMVNDRVVFSLVNESVVLKRSLKPTAKAILAFYDADKLYEEFLLGRFKQLVDDLPYKYDGPRFDDRYHPGYTDNQWLERCVTHVIHFVMSIYMSLDDAPSFVLKIVVLNPSDPSSIADWLLNSKVFSLIDQNS